jgi:hypothetical protein
MNGTEYMRLLRTREYAARTRLAMAITLHQAYDEAAARYRSTHGARPTGWLERMLPGAYSWAQFDNGWAQRMSEPFEQLRIACVGGIELLNASDEVTGTRPPAEMTPLWQQLRRMVMQGNTELRWYLNAPVSRLDTRRPWFERVVRGTVATHPIWAPALRSFGRSEGEFARAATQDWGGVVPEMPAQTALRTGEHAAAHAASQTAGIVGDPHGTGAQLVRTAEGAGKDVTAAATAAAEFAGRAAQTVRQLTPGAGGGDRPGLGWGDLLVIGGVGAVAVGGIYLFIKTRPTLIAAGKALKAVRNPDGSISYTYEDGDCG